jgi:hypothetical protein
MVRLNMAAWSLADLTQTISKQIYRITDYFYKDKNPATRGASGPRFETLAKPGPAGASWLHAA